MVKHDICVRGIYKSFNGHTVLKDCSLTVKKGESLILLGQSGTGKSVLLRCILGLEVFQKGSVTIGTYRAEEGESTARDRFFEETGVVFQSGGLFDSLSLWENITFRFPEKAHLRRAKAKDLLKKVALSPEIIEAYPSEISGGMRRRVSIARAIALNPQYLFFDEPTEGLDPLLSLSISQLIRTVIEDLGATALTITHNMKSAQIIGDRVALLGREKMAWQGGVDEFTPHCPYGVITDFIKAHNISLSSKEG